MSEDQELAEAAAVVAGLDEDSCTWPDCLGRLVLLEVDYLADYNVNPLDLWVCSSCGRNVPRISK